MTSGVAGWISELTDTHAFIWQINGVLISLERADGPPDAAAGQCVLVDSYEFEHAPDTVKAAVVLVGAVREVGDDGTVLMVTPQFGHVRVPKGASETKRGDEVEYVPSVGITRVLTAPEDTTSSQFLVPPGKYTEKYDQIVGRDETITLMRSVIEGLLDPDPEATTTHGVLFTGPPGTGKTMFAKALANESGVKAFFHLRGPEITSKWVNASEERLRELFDEARNDHTSAIIFIDELDSIAGRRSDGNHSHDNKLVGQLLTVMSSLEDSGNVLVIGATNQAHLLDPALRRNGRFSLDIPFDPPEESARLGLLANSVPADVNDPALLEHLAANTAGWNSADVIGIWKHVSLWVRADQRTTPTVEDVLLAHQRVLRTHHAVASTEGPA